MIFPYPIKERVTKTEIFQWVTKVKVKEQIRYYLGDQLIQEASSFKYLGIIIRGNLNWADQVNYTLLKKLCILPLQSQYILSLLMFVVQNKDLFKTNSDIHSFNTTFNHDLHIPVANLAVFQKGVRYSGIKIYNHLPQTLKQLPHDIPKFEGALKRFLFTHSFYILEEYYSWK
jgi:hypothetical protein